MRLCHPRTENAKLGKINTNHSVMIAKRVGQCQTMPEELCESCIQTWVIFLFYRSNVTGIQPILVSVAIHSDGYIPESVSD